MRMKALRCLCYAKLPLEISATLRNLGANTERTALTVANKSNQEPCIIGEAKGFK